LFDLFGGVWVAGGHAAAGVKDAYRPT